LTGHKSAFTVFFSFVILLALPAVVPAPAEASSKRARRAARVQTGLDVLEAQKFAPLRGKHVGLITNHTGLDSQGRSTAEFFPVRQGCRWWRFSVRNTDWPAATMKKSPPQKIHPRASGL